MYDNQRLGGVRNAIAFGAGVGRKVEIPEGFYSFLKGINFSDRHILKVTYAKKPSDPKLRQQIKELTAKH